MLLRALSGGFPWRAAQWRKTASALADAEREGYLVQVKLEEAAEKAALSDRAKFEADEAKKLAEEARNQAKCGVSCFLYRHLRGFRLQGVHGACLVGAEHQSYSPEEVLPPVHPNLMGMMHYRAAQVGTNGV